MMAIRFLRLPACSGQFQVQIDLQRVHNLPDAAANHLHIWIPELEETEVKPTFPRTDLRLDFGEHWTEAKDQIEIIWNAVADYDENVLNALIRLFGNFRNQRDFELKDFLRQPQNYVFTHGRGFDRAADDYIQKVMSGEITDASETESEPEAAAVAATSQTARNVKGKAPGIGNMLK